uniref:J domain-containing protein n=1 Tax=Arundo donax TaxID=35708 RepID=A0A0A8YFT2_ARUDO
MNCVKSALLSGHRPHHLAAAAAASFHSTTVLQRKHKTQWHNRFNYYTKRRKNREAKRSMLRNMSEYAEYLFQSWRDEDEKTDSSSGPSWFRGHRWVKNSNNSGFHPHDFYYGNFRSRGGFDFCTSDEDEPEIVFRNAFRQQQTYYWSFSSDNFRWRNTRHAHSENSRNWSYETDDEDEVSAPSEVSLARQALGLSASGPLKLEDVKSAYRTCALRWHPDRHNGSSKAKAEEKFKHCSAAYKTLCDSLATA